jgi:hypothetical protein
MLEATVLTALLGVAEVQAPNPEEEATPYFRMQVMLDAGVPDGFGLGLSLAPLPHIRLSVAGLTNIIGFGARGGLALVPFASWPLHPIIALDAGRYFTGNPQTVVPGVPVTRFTYDFVDATVGLEMMLRSFVIRLGGGASRVWAALPDSTESSGTLAVDTVLPCAKLALAWKLN